MSTITAAYLRELYQQADAEGRAYLRQRYPRMGCEFDAVERDEDRQQRLEAVR